MPESSRHNVTTATSIAKFVSCCKMFGIIEDCCFLHEQTARLKRDERCGTASALSQKRPQPRLPVLHVRVKLLVQRHPRRNRRPPPLHAPNQSMKIINSHSIERQTERRVRTPCSSLLWNDTIRPHRGATGICMTHGT